MGTKRTLERTYEVLCCNYVLSMDFYKNFAFSLFFFFFFINFKVINIGGSLPGHKVPESLIIGILWLLGTSRLK